MIFLYLLAFVCAAVAVTATVREFLHRRRDVRFSWSDGSQVMECRLAAAWSPRWTPHDKNSIISAGTIVGCVRAIDQHYQVRYQINGGVKVLEENFKTPREAKQAFEEGFVNAVATR